jgi:hypothetical protein
MINVNAKKDWQRIISASKSFSGSQEDQNIKS